VYCFGWLSWSGLLCRVTASQAVSNNNNSEFYIALFCKKKTKRTACASLVEREEKGFEVVLKR